LHKILDYGKNITVKDRYLLLKGIEYQKEVNEAEKKWSFCYKVHNSLTSKNGKILEISDVRKIT
jgi:16S rRNA (guanine527-N7)-methyltransferase